jgi:hypothetical protein
MDRHIADHTCHQPVVGTAGMKRFFQEFDDALLVRQNRWEMRQHMPENGRISGKSQVYLLQIRERDTALLLTRIGRQLRG